MSAEFERSLDLEASPRRLKEISGQHTSLQVHISLVTVAFGETLQSFSIESGINISHANVSILIILGSWMLT